MNQFYLFTMPDDMCPVWAEVFLADGGHHVAPTPYSEVEYALAKLEAAHPGATVDTLWLPQDISECRGWARTMPLKQIPA